MQGTRIYIIGILITTFSFTQVEMEIRNVNTTSGTLDINMKSVAGCSYCTDNKYTTKETCLVSGSDPNSAAAETVLDATWEFDSTSPNAATCAGVCSNATQTAEHITAYGDVSQYLSEITCTSLENFAKNGLCSDATKNREQECEEVGTCSGADTQSTNQTDCLDADKNGGVGTFTSAGNIWTDNTWTESAINGIWFTGEVSGFQFQLTNINVSNLNSASGGSADANNFLVQTAGTDGAVGTCSNATFTSQTECETASETWTGTTFILGFLQTTGGPTSIPAGDGTLTQISFTDFDETEICFGDGTTTCLSNDGNMISDKNGECVATSWTCYCATEEDLGCGCGAAAPSGCDNVCGSTAVADCLGECGGTAVVDCLDVCAGTAIVDCAGTCGGSVVLTDCGCDETESDANDCCADGLSPNDEAPDCAGTCGGSGIDSDTDGVCNSTDECLDTPAGETVFTTGDSLGCSESQLSVSQISVYMPEEFSISQNYPNPFNPVTSITFDVVEMDEIYLIVYDLAGKEVATLASGVYAPGRYMVEWNAINNAGDGIVSGMYIYRYISNEKAINRKMLYLK